MKVVHLTNSNETTMLGIERHVLSLVSAQRARGLDSIVVTDLPAGVFAEACREQSIPMAAVPGLGPGPLVPAEQVMSSLLAHFDSVGAELIHCHTPPTAIHAIPAGNRAKIPCVLTIHTQGSTRPLADAQKAGMRFTMITVNRDSFEYIKSRNDLCVTNLYYVPNGTKTVPLAHRVKAPRSDHPNLIIVGSIAPRKGVDIAILATAELRRRHGPGSPALSIYGEGRDEKYLREMTSIIGMSDTVQFCGFQNDILDHCASTDILLVPSRAETGPLVVLEAMSRGMPAVASDVGMVAEMLPDRRYGHVVPVNSPVAVADAIESITSDIASGHFDPDLVIERHRSLYSIEKMTESIESIYKQVLAEHS